MGKLKNQAGFSAIEIILLLVIVGIIGFVGWYVHSAINNTDKDLSPANNTAVAPKKKTAAASTKTTAQKYLTISQLGIKLPLSSGISDLIYTYDANSGSPLLFFSTTSLSTASPGCALTSSAATTARPFGSINAVTTPYPAAQTGTLDGQAGTLYAHVNKYYLYWTQAQSDCQQTQANGGQPSQSETNLLNTQLPLFQAAVKGAITAN